MCDQVKDNSSLPLIRASVPFDIARMYRLPYTARKEVTMQAYCMKCRTKREMKDARSITMKNGRPATQGVCPVCGTKMFRIGKG